MTGQIRATRPLAAGVLVLCVAAGCKTAQTAQPHHVAACTPGESAKVGSTVVPVARPDAVTSNPPRTVPKGSYKIEPRDTLIVRPAAPLPGEPTNLILIVDRTGAIDVGAAYGGRVRVAGLTLAAARKAVEKASPLKNSEVALGLYESAAACEATGPEPVRTEVRAPRRGLVTGFRRVAEPQPVATKPLALTVAARPVATVMPPLLEPAAPGGEPTVVSIDVIRPGTAPTIVIPPVPPTKPDRGSNRPRSAQGVSDTSRLRN